MPGAATLILCAGKDCTGARGFRGTRRLAVETPGALISPCQGICHGPVVGVRRGSDVRWYRTIRGKRRAALRRLVASGRGRRRLRDAEARRYRGRLRHAARLRPLDR